MPSSECAWRFVTRRLAADRARGDFVVVDPARFFREAAADVRRAADHFAQLREDLRGEVDHLAVLGARLVQVGARRRRVVARGGARHPHLRRRQPRDVDVVADGTGDQRGIASPIELAADANHPSKRWPWVQLRSKMIMAVKRLEWGG